MGKNKNNSSTKVKKTSSGKRHDAKIQDQMARIDAKINRWKKNRDDPIKRQTGPKGHKCVPKCKSRHNGWNTDKLVEHVQRLESMIASSKKKRFAQQGEK